MACQKETSFETGKGFGGVAEGSLWDSSGNCQTAVVNGVYQPGTALTDSNYIWITIVTTTPGSYVVFTDTANGMWFRDSGYFINPGPHTIKLKGYGVPLLALVTNVIIQYNASFCVCAITPVGAVPASTADYFPTTTGSNWSYKNAVGSSTDTIYVSAIDKLAFISGNVYSELVQKVGNATDTLYVRKSNGSYYQYGRFLTGSTVTEYTFLQDNLPVNSIWETPDLTASTIGSSYQFKVRFTITAKDISTTINGNALDSVITVKQDIMLKVATNNYQTLYTSSSSYAKKIGMVEYVSSTDTPAFDYQITRWKVY